MKTDDADEGVVDDDEVLRVVCQVDDMHIRIRASVFTPVEWGVVLYDLAQHIADASIQAGLMVGTWSEVHQGPEPDTERLATREEVLRSIVECITHEHGKGEALPVVPTGTTRH